MNALTSAAINICIIAVAGAIVKILIPDCSLTKNMNMVINLILATVILTSVIPIFSQGIELDTDKISNEDYASDYTTDRITNTISDSIENEVKQTLKQFGINNGQISIDFYKGNYGSVELKHISVIVPKEYAKHCHSIKKILLNKFDVYCDVYEAED